LVDFWDIALLFALKVGTTILLFVLPCMAGMKEACYRTQSLAEMKSLEFTAWDSLDQQSSQSLPSK
jgi:hypothetical protein